jgi:polyhydroxybutyrate depolymerase
MRKYVLSRVPGARWVLPGVALLCAAIMGAAILSTTILSANPRTAHGDAPASPSPPVRIARSVQTAGKATLIRSVYTMNSGGRIRQWTQLAPPGGLTGSDPVIIVLSGINATVNMEITRDHLTSYVQAGKAELVYPAGYKKSWNAGGCCGQAAKAGINDTGFLTALVADVDPGHRHPVDLVGYSNGGRLAYRIACADPELVDQIAVVKAMPEPGCVVTRPVTILQIDSTNDSSVPYQPGDKGKETPPATVEVGRLKATDGCATGTAATGTAATRTAATRTAATGTAATTTQTRGALRLTTWRDCADGTRLAFAVYRGGGHSFPQPTSTTPSAATVIWAFFTNAPSLANTRL